MHLTSYDNYIVTSKNPQVIVFELYRTILSKWPSVIVLNESDEEEPFKGKFPSINLFPKSEGALYFCRDAAMNKHWDENGYSLLSDGEGPFAFRYFEKINYKFSFQMIDDFTALENNGINCCPESLINAIGLNYFDITLTTPSSPEDNVFSKFLLDLVSKTCSDIR